MRDLAELELHPDEIDQRLGPPRPEDFGFHHPLDYVETAVSLLRASQWRCWPDDGGWASQDQSLIDDVMTYLRVERRVRWEVEHGWTNIEQSQGMDAYPHLSL